MPCCFSSATCCTHPFLSDLLHIAYTELPDIPCLSPNTRNVYILVNCWKTVFLHGNCSCSYNNAWAWAWCTWILGSPCIAYLGPLGCTMGLQPIPKYTNISHSHKWGQCNLVTISSSWVQHYYQHLPSPKWRRMWYIQRSLWDFKNTNIIIIIINKVFIRVNVSCDLWTINIY